MRPPFVVYLLFSAALPARAVPPANDQFASRTAIPAVPPPVTGTNAEATAEAGENLQGGLFGATVWWKWTAPANGWVRVDTDSSDFDTVLQISTGTTLAGQTLVAFNDDGPDTQLQKASSINFWAAAGTVYNIAVGGYEQSEDDGPYMGNISLNFTTGASATPPWYPATLSLSAPAVNVTSAAAPVTASFTIVAARGTSYGTAGVGFEWEPGSTDRALVAPAVSWNGSSPQTVLQQSFTVQRSTPQGVKAVFVKVNPSGPGNTLVFSSSGGGTGYALPSAVAQSLTVTNTGSVDDEAPALSPVGLSPLDVDVTTAPAALAVSATLTDNSSGVQAVEIQLDSDSAPLQLTAQLALTSGTAQSGTWTGTVNVPKSFPTGNYMVLIRAVDGAQNSDRWGVLGTRETPGGDISVIIFGGSVYEKWAYSTWFNAGDANAGSLDDADGDGKPNLLSYAFDLDPRSIRNSTGSLPQVELFGTGPSRKLRVTYIRRKAATNSGLTYQPQFSSSTNGIWETVTGGTATSISTEWERVTVEDTVSVGTEGKRFARVKVEYAAP